MTCLTENERTVLDEMANGIRNVTFDTTGGDLPAQIATRAYEALPEVVRAVVRGLDRVPKPVGYTFQHNDGQLSIDYVHATLEEGQEAWKSHLNLGAGRLLGVYTELHFLAADALAPDAGDELVTVLIRRKHWNAVRKAFEVTP